VRCSIAYIFTLALASPLGVQAQAAVHVDTAVTIPMGDGVLLRADIWRPESGAHDRHLPSRDQPERLVLDRTLTANRFLPGRRVRIVVSSSFTPYSSVNPQTGEQEFASRSTPAGTITIHHSPRQPSRLILPLLPGTATH
jgi:predicted acyl esterase